MKTGLLALLGGLLAFSVYAGEFDSFAIDALGDVATYSHQENFSPAVKDVYIGYDVSGNPVAAAAMRTIKSYSTVNGLVSVELKDGQWVIREATIPDIARIRGAEKQQKVLDAIKAFRGSTVRDAGGELQKVDAVTGATRYQEAISLYFNLLAKTAVETAVQNPGWTRMPVSK